MKQSRLLEIIREEITSILNEGEAEEKAAKMAAIKAADLEIKALQKKKADMMKSGVAESTLEEDLLNETPIYDVNDMEGFKSTLDKFREEGVSKSKALNLLLTKLEDEGTVDTNALSKEYGVDTATFNNKEIRKFLNRPEDEMFTDKSGEELIDFTPFLGKADKKRGRVAGEKPEGGKSEPKEKTALPDSGIIKKKGKEEPKAEEPKAEKPKAEEPKKSEEGPKVASSKLDKISDDKDALLKIQRQAKDKMKELANKMKGLEGKERDKLMGELKKVNTVKADVDKKLDKLGY